MSGQGDNNSIKKPDDWSVSGLDEEARRNLFGFFALLLKVDMRNNPHLYKNADNRGADSADKGTKRLSSSRKRRV